MLKFLIHLILPKAPLLSTCNPSEEEGWRLEILCELHKTKWPHHHIKNKFLSPIIDELLDELFPTQCEIHSVPQSCG